MKEELSSPKITIIGGGNLGRAMAEGFLHSGEIPASNVHITRRKVALLEDLKDRGLKVGSDNLKACESADIIILAVKPKTIRAILAEIKPALHPRLTLVSVVTGFTLLDIQAEIGEEVPLFRAMPNTAIAIRESLTCISSNNTQAEQRETISQLFENVGKVVHIEDELMGAATVLGACGVAFALRYIRAASQGGIEIGFSSKDAQLIAAQVVKGAATLLLENGQHPEQEIDKVTTPQGCTIVGLNEMEHQGFSPALIRGLKSSYAKIADIAEFSPKTKPK